MNDSTVETNIQVCVTHPLERPRWFLSSWQKLTAPNFWKNDHSSCWLTYMYMHSISVHEESEILVKIFSIIRYVIFQTLITFI